MTAGDLLRDVESKSQASRASPLSLSKWVEQLRDQVARNRRPFILDDNLDVRRIAVQLNPNRGSGRAVLERVPDQVRE